MGSGPEEQPGRRLGPRCRGMHSPGSWGMLAGAVALVLLLLTQQTSAIEWLSIAKNGQKYWNKTSDCSKSKTEGLIKQQMQICKRNLELMPVVAQASRDVVDVCQFLFQHYRWNCTSLTFAPNYMADLTGGSREQAFVHALSSAALAQAISKACAQGATTKCSCGRIPNEPPPAEFKWGGCGDDLRFGMIFSASFADSPWVKKRRSRKSVMNIHNNMAGRKVVSESLVTDCKCHGVSGSCTIKTCWKALPDLRTLGVAIQKRYSIAVEVTNKKMKGSKDRKLVPVMRNKKSVDEEDLIYIAKSPDYCLPDESMGSLGTHERECDKASTGSNGCQSMCCGRGFTSRVVEVRHRCECKYYWCCYVKCKTCTKKVEINRCR